jgi:hypothetical protein
MPGPPPKLRLLVRHSAAADDVALAGELLKHLSPLMRFAGLDVWSEPQIKAGDNWRHKIHKAIGEADVALLLLSSDFLSSDGLLDGEVPRLLERHRKSELRVIPVVLRQCLWDVHPWLNELQPLPKNGKAIVSFSGSARDEVLAELVKDILKLANISSHALLSDEAYELRGGDAPAHRKALALREWLTNRTSRWSMIVGGDEDRSVLRAKLERLFRENQPGLPAGTPLSVLAQLFAVRFCRERLTSLFERALVERALDGQTPPLIDALARLVSPGVHVTLRWVPVLERAVARHHPDRTVAVLHPSRLDAEGRPWVIKRAAGSSVWEKVEPGVLPWFDLSIDFVVLRLYGGYSAEQSPTLTYPILTEEDHEHVLGWTKHFGWADELIAQLRHRPGVFSGLSTLPWRHRMLLYRLYEKPNVPAGSWALLGPHAHPAEDDLWERGRGLPGEERIRALREDPEALARLLGTLRTEAHEP